MRQRETGQGSFPHTASKQKNNRFFSSCRAPRRQAPSLCHTQHLLTPVISRLQHNTPVLQDKGQGAVLRKLWGHKPLSTEGTQHHGTAGPRCSLRSGEQQSHHDGRFLGPTLITPAGGLPNSSRRQGGTSPPRSFQMSSNAI